MLRRVPRKVTWNHNLVGTVTDALSIRDYSIAAVVGTGDAAVSYGLAASSLVDAYNADELTTSVPLNEAVTLPFLGVQEGTDGPDEVGMLRVSARDQADGTAMDADPVAIGDIKEVPAMDFEITPDDDSEASTLTIKAVVTSEKNPFENVIFYAAADNDEDSGDMMDLRFIASIPEYSARGSGGKWTYTARVSADDFYAAVSGEDNYTGNVYAVGVSAAGSVAGAKVTTTVTTTTTAAGGRQEVTKDADGNTTATNLIYAAAATGLTVLVDTDGATDLADDGDDTTDYDGDDILNNDFVATTSGSDILDDVNTTLFAVQATAVFNIVVTDTQGTDAAADDVQTLTRTTEVTTVTLTKLGTAAVLGDNPTTTDVVESDFETEAAVPAEGKIKFATTTETFVGSPGVTDLGSATVPTGVASYTRGETVTTSSDVDDITVNPAPTADDADDPTDDEGSLVIVDGATTTVIHDESTASLAVVVSTSVPGESTDIAGGVGLKSAGVMQEVDER